MTEDRSRYRCAFCGRHQDDVGHLIAGQGVYICDGCVETCALNFSGGSHYDKEKRTWIEHAPLSPWPRQRKSHFGDSVACSFCGKLEPDVQWLVRGGAGPNTFICDECVGLCQMIVRDSPSAPTAAGRPAARRRRWSFTWPWQPPHLDKATRS